MPTSPRSAKELFVAALELADPAAQAAFLDRECAGDPALRARLDALLRAHDGPAPVLDQPLVAPGAADPTSAYRPAAPPTGTFGAPDPAADPAPGPDAGAVLGGRYKLVEPVGEGGMGAVWVAQQTEPVRRVVAVKLIKAGMDSKAVLARFEAERQALALMDHPNIARVLDGGAAPDGRPYFVMELVKGVPITRYCDERKLTPRQRLELFIPVCQAIQHAHQKGVIHRDVKPSNVLVALYDDRPVPKVIDFGIAKATGPALTDKTLLTGFGAVVGTPEYMSPEQASLNNLDVDTRSDVYSLGVLLYELLAGSPPFRSDELKAAGLLEMLRVVREVDPPRPSTKLSTAHHAASLSASRGTEPRKLAGLLRGELDWIVMRALEKDRGRRYESASGFAADVGRYLAGEPVQAVPPSAGYRLRKFARRHRAVLATAAAFALLLLTATAVSGWLAVKARQAEGEATRSAGEATRSAGDARRAEAHADEQRREADRSARKANQARWEATAERITSDIKAMSLQVDLDLADLKADPRAGLLRLARPTKNPGDPVPVKAIPADDDGEVLYGLFQFGDRTRPEYRALREFVTAAVLANGQKYAPLLPPLAHGGTDVGECHVSPDGKTALTRGDDGAARLWDVRSGRALAVLREADERVVRCGFTPDGRTVYTDDASDTLRFWDCPAGTLRARSGPRPYALPKAVRLDRKLTAGNDRVLKVLEVHVPAEGEPPGTVTNVNYAATPVELWDTRTGRLVARIDPSPWLDAERARQTFGAQLVADGKWVALTPRSQVVIVSALDGREAVRLAVGAGHVVSAVVEVDGTLGVTTRGPDGYRLQLWDTGTWRPRPHAVGPKTVDNLYLAYATENELGVYAWDDLSDRRLLVYRNDSAAPVADCRCDLLATPQGQFRASGFLASEDGRVFDARTWQHLRPPAGRRFHPGLSHFAWDGRFAVLRPDRGLDRLIDLATEKPVIWNRNTNLDPMHPAPGGLVMPQRAGDGMRMRLIPTGPLDIPPELLELWVQVAVCGELGSAGEFVKWGQERWEAKRRELAAAKPPHPDLPFPGHLATDKLHWLRAEFEVAPEAEKLGRARELLRRAGELGDRNEAARWRREVEARAPELAPAPREVRP